MGAGQGAEGSAGHSLTVERSEGMFTLRIHTLDFAVPPSHQCTVFRTLAPAATLPGGTGLQVTRARGLRSLLAGTVLIILGAAC